MVSSSLLLASLAALGAASAAPTTTLSSDLLTNQLGLTRRAPSDGVVTDIPIHESCNGTQRAQIQKGFDDMKTLAQVSLDRLFAHGPTDEFFVKYFGEGADPAPVVGYLEEVLYSDKSETLFRCDDPDANCKNLPDWAGHWRGNNATQETVICERSYHTRRPLEQVCGLGFQLARDNPSLYWGSDFLHRVFHVPAVVHEKIHHISDGYNGALELARTNVNGSVSNQHSIQYYTLDVYSRTVIEEGCVGTPLTPEEEAAAEAASHGGSSSSSSSAAPAATATDAASASASAAPATEPTASAAPAADADCHTHADGSVHCGAH